jgi:predicted SAM-dependent methyltransferase
MPKLNLGCGKDYREGYINADISDEVNADITFDVQYGIPYKNNYFSEVIANNVLTQIADSKTFIFVMNELWRVTEGNIFIRVPYALHECAWQDPADVRRFTEQSFTYMEHGHRRYEQYGRHYGFKPFIIELLDHNGRQMTFKLCPKKD